MLFFFIMEMLVLMIKNTGTACIAIPMMAYILMIVLI